MSGLAHFLEDEGLSTVVIALVREHVVKMSPPRALWVPFEMGRPFATPNDVELQSRVLKSAFSLFDEPGSKPILKDYAEEATINDSVLNWKFPGKLDAKSPAAEADLILPIWQKTQERRERTVVGISDMSLVDAVEYIDKYLSPHPMINPKGMAPVSRARFAIDDIKVFYFEAALADGGLPSSYQLNEWFWKQTLTGKMILDFQDKVRFSKNKNLRLISDSLVPPERTYEYLK